MRRTKIVSTLGPATWDRESLASLLEAGADVVRLNLAHADPPTHIRVAGAARSEAARLGKTIGILADLPGPKMRTGPIAADEVALEPGQRFTLFHRSKEGDASGVSTTVPNLAELVAPNDEIFLADGAVILKVISTDSGDVHTEVVRRGLLRSRKGMHVPKAEARIESFTRDDQLSLQTAVEAGADLIGLSFIRDARDVAKARSGLSSVSSSTQPLLVAKIETRSATENLDQIVALSDAVMVARGDLGIQLPFKDVPLLQKEIIRTCNRAGVPVITATQMLESMTHGPLPSRAEVNDVANAVLDGTDALMLSEETAVGRFPTETVRTMADIAEAAERRGRSQLAAIQHEEAEDPVSWAIARAAVHAAEELQVATIVCPTRSGATARRVAAFRPSMPILALGHEDRTVRPLALVWGVVPKTLPFLPEELAPDETVPRALEAARSSGLAQPGHLVAVVAGGPEPRAGSTDFVRIVSA
ncbi:MAG: pyruvate kinase [Actinomycetota bacterium]|nr:pyruvate kinase [Actinomycetota bacterium]